MTESRWRVSNFLRKVRALRGWSLRKAAKAAGISHVHLADVEAHRRRLSAKAVIAIADGWGVDRALVESAWLDDERDRAMAEMLDAQRR